MKFRLHENLQAKYFISEYNPIYIPVQVVWSELSWNPALHRHLKLPSVFTQTCWHLFKSAEHSLTSVHVLASSSSAYPSLQRQLNDPMVLTQPCSHIDLLSHSLMSAWTKYLMCYVTKKTGTHTWTSAIVRIYLISCHAFTVKSSNSIYTHLLANTWRQVH